MIKNELTAGKIRLNLTNSRITIKPSHDDKVYLTSKREKEYSFEQNDTTLTLNQKERSKWTYFIPNWRLATKTELLIPSSFKGGIWIENKDGWIVFSDLNPVELEINNRNGKVILSNIESEKIKTKSNNGKIIPHKIKTNTLEYEANNGKIKGGEIVAKDSVTMNSKNGKIIIDDLSCNNISLESHNGKIFVALSGEEKQYAFNIVSKNGKSVIAGKANIGSYILRDKEKAKSVSAKAHNGKVVLTFLNKD